MSNINDRSEQEQILAVKCFGWSIKDITNPSEAVQLAAVKTGGAIQYIPNPSEAVQLAAVKKDGHAIQYIKDPSEEVQLEAIKNNIYSIQHINNPTEKVQLEAVRKNKDVIIIFIKNPSEAVKLADVDTRYDSTADTKKHIAEVVDRVNQVCSELMVRAKEHDRSKLASPEKEVFDRVGENLKGLTYGSAEYNKQLEGMSNGLKHHYSVNRHHPNHWAFGISGMSLLDLIEMLADWKAAGARHADGSMRSSLDKNRVRFNISDELYRMLERTCYDLGWL